MPAELVGLQAARSSLAMETAGGVVEVERDPPAAGSKTQVIRLRLTAPRPLPPGRVASLEFRLAESLIGHKEVPLKITGGSASTSEQQTIAIQHQDGKITISEDAPTLVNCFFFTH